MTFILAYLIPLIIIIFSGNKFIKFMEKINFGQQIRASGPKSHLKKAGIATMGGLLIIITFLLVSIFFLDLKVDITAILITTIIMSLTGFLDDFLKIKLKRSLGLKAAHKIMLQVLAALIITFTVIFILENNKLIIPFYGGYKLNFLLKFILSFLVVIGSSNAVNLTDGLDGLAAGVTTIVTFAFAFLFYYLNLSEYSLLMLIMAGSTTGFLWFNSHPAQIFMGDVGSLAIGAFLGSAAVLTGTEFFLLIIGAVYVIETVSVIIQVPYFKLTGGKRIFKMTPIHHHFELKGMAENKIVFRFIIFTVILSLFAVSSLLYL